MATEINLDTAQAIVAAALDHGGKAGLKPLAAAVLDARGALKAFAAQDGTSLKRGEVALAKAQGALALGMGGRALMARAEQQPSFIAAVSHVVGGMLVPVPGGVLVESDGATIGAVGISGDASENDEAAAIAGIESVGLTAKP